MQTDKAELYLDLKLQIGEGPWWDTASGRLYWVDILGKKVGVVETETGAQQSWPVSQCPGAAIPAIDGRIVVPMQDGIYMLDPANGAQTLLCHVENDMPGNRFNDAKCDAKGRLWFGSMSEAANDPDAPFTASGSLYKLDKGKPVRMFGDVGISNGLGWSADNRRMYYIDSAAACVSAWKFDLETGIIREKREAARLEAAQGMPDGMAADAEGMIWVAHFGGGKVGRWNPETGELLATVELPVTLATSCCFGGPNLDILYITTASAQLPPERKADEPLAGGLFVHHPGVKGLPMHKFNPDV